jgi:hypothetical protein
MIPEISTFIAWWGAGLSTLLAIVKLRELWADRFRVEVDYNFTGNENIGNKILIRNIFSRPLILSHWKVLFCSGHWPLRKFENILCSDLDAGDIRIESHSSQTLHFVGESDFDWGQETLKGRRIYIRLYVAGRQPILKLVYPK